MTLEQAQAIAAATWGSRGFFRENRRWRGDEKPRADGWAYPEGELYGYSIGYHRTGKRGARLSTVKGHGDTLESTLIDALRNTDGEHAYVRLEAAIQKFSK